MINHVTIRPRADIDRTAIRDLLARTLPPVDAGDPEGLDRVVWAPGMLSMVAEAEGVVVGTIVGNLIDDDRVLNAAVTVIAVEEAYRRQGVGRGLLTSFELAIRDAGAVGVWTGGGQPRFWWPGLDAERTDALAFFEAADYAVEDEAANMCVDLHTADLAPRPTNAIEIRRLTVEDSSAFAQWMDDEWDDPWGAEVEGALLREPVACHVARLDGDIVGFAAYDTNRRGWFGPMGTTSRLRGSGIGAELLRRCLRDYLEQGRSACEIGWVGPPQFYAKAVGATMARRYLRLWKRVNPQLP